MRKNPKRNKDGTFAAELSARIKKGKKAPKSSAWSLDTVDVVAFPKPKVNNYANIDPTRLTPGEAQTLEQVFTSAMTEPKNADEVAFVNQQRKMLENVFGPINWNK